MGQARSDQLPDQKERQKAPVVAVLNRLCRTKYNREALIRHQSRPLSGAPFSLGVVEDDRPRPPNDDDQSHVQLAPGSVQLFQNRSKGWPCQIRSRHRLASNLPRLVHLWPQSTKTVRLVVHHRRGPQRSFAFAPAEVLGGSGVSLAHRISCHLFPRIPSFAALCVNLPRAAGQAVKIYEDRYLAHTSRAATHLAPSRSP